MDQILQEIIPYLPESVQRVLFGLPEDECLKLQEIRLKRDSPLILRFHGIRRVCPGTLLTKQEMEGVFRRVCASSAYTHRNEIRSGYVTIPGGHRVGLAGTAVLGASGVVEGMREICGLTFRVAREHKVDVNPILSDLIYEGKLRNLMIAGPPCSGKTTLLRCLANVLADRYQIVVVDEREELFPLSRSVPIGCDVLRGYPKATGILQGLRTLSPEVVICDEIGKEEEVRAMLDGLQSGVSLIVSAHAFSTRDFLSRPPIRTLFHCGGIDFVVFLDGKDLGKIVRIKGRDEIVAEASDIDSDFPDVFCNGDVVRG